MYSSSGVLTREQILLSYSDLEPHRNEANATYMVLPHGHLRQAFTPSTCRRTLLTCGPSFIASDSSNTVSLSETNRPSNDRGKVSVPAHGATTCRARMLRSLAVGVYDHSSCKNDVNRGRVEADQLLRCERWEECRIRDLTTLGHYSTAAMIGSFV